MGDSPAGVSDDDAVHRLQSLMLLACEGTTSPAYIGRDSFSVGRLRPKPDIQPHPNAWLPVAATGRSEAEADEPSSPSSLRWDGGSSG